MDKKTYVTENFCREEFCVTSTGFFNVPSKAEWDNLYYGIKKLLQPLRERIGVPIIITSGYRTPEWNKKAGGAKYSYHMRGMAADIRVDGMTAKEIANKLNAIVPDECGIIVYRSWVHLDVRTAKYRKGV